MYKFTPYALHIIDVLRASGPEGTVVTLLLRSGPPKGESTTYLSIARRLLDWTQSYEISMHSVDKDRGHLILAASTNTGNPPLPHQ